jgi:perosamine synthetase
MDRIPQFMPYIDSREYEAIKECFDALWITEGPKSKEFSQKLCEFMHVKHGVFAPNGTLALYLGLRAIGIGQSDEVLVPDFTFIASANSIEMTGASPVFVDVDRTYYQMDIKACEKALSKRTKAIMPVHIYGMAANMDKIMDFANKNGLLVIEDAAQALGVTHNSKHCGTFGDVGCFSFFADKTITTAEGGFVVTNSDKIHNDLLYLRNQGRLNRGTFTHDKIGYNFRITDMQAAVGLTQLAKFDEIYKRKQEIYRKYAELLQDIEDINLTAPPNESNYIPFRVTFTSSKLANDVMWYLSKHNIEARSFFYPLHKQPCYRHLRFNSGDFPNSAFLYEYGVCLPSFVTLTDEQIETVCDTLMELFK